MASISLITATPWLPTKTTQHVRIPSASLTLLTGRSSVSVNAATTTSTTRPGLLHCSFLASSSLSFPSSFSVKLEACSELYEQFAGLSLGLDFNSNIGKRKEKGHRLVVRAGKAALCLTKRNRSRKSLARTHGFRRRMRTTTGRAVLKRRRAKGRWVLCTKTNSNSGKRKL
ncbi:hypothetical protein JRO89_XS06G0053400 [Xanthoceras sorbifolium]|uniref:50S ribosomal protein L34, chloroplastic n=1 Tax=Xanthoceras sorbifolium TaxID=99658 RepID=A0ABQ8HWT5_9ROSI|nr:hypothetical protein JRO89_XS06G0053400 [Xanthoceras sorbifolium]